MLRRDFLETCQVFARGSSVAFPLKCARQAEFRRSMKRSKGQPLLKRRDGLVIFLQLGVQVADEITGVRFVGRDLCDVLKSGDALLRLPEVFVGESEVVPSVSILGKLLRCRFECRARRLQLLLAEQRNAQIQPGDCKFGVGLEGLLKVFLRVPGALLIHVGNAQGIETIGFHNPAARRPGLLCSRGLLLCGRCAGTHQYRGTANQD